jgi:hypothetical protein
MAITTKEFFEFCRRFDKDIMEVDISTNYGMGASIENVNIKAYEPIRKGDGTYDLLGTIMIDTKCLDKVVEDKLMERFAEKLVEKYSTPHIKPELLGVGDKRWYRTVVHDMKELEMAVSISNTLFNYFNSAVEKELDRILSSYK